jgi:predicted lysophospholipase L1 biosynthesis ABC-type transport system permease subunit
VLSERLARELFGAEDPLGQTVVTMFGGVEMEIVGVVEDVRFASLASDPEAVIYQPLSHWSSRGVHLVVRSRRPLASLAPALRDAIGAVHAEQPIREITTLETLVARSVARPRFYALLLGAFAACTLALAMIGFHGLLVGTVVQRRREIGIRMALGADAASVRRVVVRRAVLLTAAGAALGIGATVAGGRLIEGLLFGVAAADPPTLVGVGFLIVLTSAAAAWAPARRATRVDPCEALRRE